VNALSGLEIKLAKKETSLMGTRSKKQLCQVKYNIPFFYLKHSWLNN
jgi:hypothetical protein